MYYAGIDYHKRYSVVCALNEDGKIALEATVKPNTPDGFASLFDRLDGPVKTVFECGLNWRYLHDLLEELPAVDEVVLAHAAQVRIIAEAQIKTDKIDARKLAWLLRGHSGQPVHCNSIFLIRFATLSSDLPIWLIALEMFTLCPMFKRCDSQTVVTVVFLLSSQATACFSR